MDKYIWIASDSILCGKDNIIYYEGKRLQKNALENKYLREFIKLGKIKEM